MNALHLGDRVRTRGEVPVYGSLKPHTGAYSFEVLSGRVVELTPNHVEVAVDDWATYDWAGTARFKYTELEHER